MGQDKLQATASSFMNIFPSPFDVRYPRPQAKRIARLFMQGGVGFHGALLGKQREGKTDLLQQIHSLLFERAEGPIPFLYSFHPRRKEGTLAQNFLADFMLQVRAFVLRDRNLLLEPPVSIQQELERPGLPFSLAEMGENFLAFPLAEQCEFAPVLPALFANRERRPVCLLLDDTHHLGPSSEYLSALDSTNLLCLLSGRRPYISRMAGISGWPLVYLEPLSREETVLQARQCCETAGLEFSPQAWDQWSEMNLLSAWQTACLVTSAAVQGEPIHSIEELGRLYVQELASGTLGNWLSVRLDRTLPDRGDRATVVKYLAQVARTGNPTGSAGTLPSRVWDALVAEEWAEETTEGPRLVLDTVERDWLSFCASSMDKSSKRATSRLLLAFLLRVKQTKEQPETVSFSSVIRQTLLNLPKVGFPEFFEHGSQEIRLPKILSVSPEAALTAELFWCYGFYGENFQDSETGTILLIVVCNEPPTDSQVRQWHQQLENEARVVQPEEAAETQAKQVTGLLQELWVAVPPGTSLLPSSTERRFSWETFFHLVVQTGSSGGNLRPTLGE